jgi:threonine/homoserine efflux transporter RhtA
MPIHLDVLGRLHVMLGVLGVLAGASLLALAGGTSRALIELDDATDAGQVGVWILLWCGAVFAIGGVALWLTGRALGRRRPASRRVALALAVPNLLVVPFGTALSIYAFWVLLNDEARRAFGRPPRSTRPAGEAPGSINTAPGAPA